MLYISKLKYRLTALLETGERLDLTSVCKDISWEEYENELSTSISFSAYNVLRNGKYLAGLIKPNTLITVLSNYAGEWKEVARGTLNSWEPEESNSARTFSGTANDTLYNLQNSQEYRYITDGTGTKAAIEAIFKDWGIAIGVYDGPNATHSKKIYKSDYIGDIIVDLLDDAKKKGAKRCFIRSREGMADVIPRGSNNPVYVISSDNNATSVISKISTQNMVTRVIVMSGADKDKRQRIEAVVDGKTEYGIMQKITTRDDEESLEEAKAAAHEILEESGKPNVKYELSDIPDIPPLRKGDKVYIHAATLDGFYYVKSVAHHASSASMSIKVEEADDINAEIKRGGKGDFETGDRVILNGAVYSDSYGAGKGQTFTDYEDVITIKVSTDRNCPYHIGSIGWVYPDSITKASNV